MGDESRSLIVPDDGYSDADCQRDAHWIAQNIDRLFAEGVYTEADVVTFARSYKKFNSEISERESDTESEYVAKESARLKASFIDFIVEAWPHVEKFALIMGPHIKVMADHLQGLEEGQLPNGDTFHNLLINVPPEHTKSVVVSVLWPAWIWARTPHAGIVGVAYADTIAERDLRKCRTLITSDWYQRFFPDVQIGGKDSADYMELTSGGFRIATTPGGKLTGLHMTHLIFDDLLSAAQAERKIMRESVILWLKETTATRGVAMQRRIAAVAQRFHQRDWCGYLLGTGEYVHVMMPARFEPDRAFKDVGFGGDWRTKAGELLFPARFPEHILSALENRLQQYGVAGQLQQRPAPRGGGLFKIDRIGFELFKNIDWENCVVVARGWDTAGTEDAGDYTAGVLIAVIRVPSEMRSLVYILDVFREQVDAGEVAGKIKETTKRDKEKYGDEMGLTYYTVVEEEGGGAGKYMGKDLRRRLAGLPVRTRRVTGKKSTRAIGIINAVSDRDVCIAVESLDPAKLPEFVQVLLNELENDFNSDHDDQIDGWSLVYNDVMDRKYLSLGPDETEEEPLDDCENEKCDRLAALDSDYCCPSCSEAHEQGRSLGEDHELLCNNRHGQLYAKKIWLPESMR